MFRFVIELEYVYLVSAFEKLACSIYADSVIIFYLYAMQPHQRDVTTLLAAAVQACHEMVAHSTFSLYFVTNDFSSLNFLK